MVQDEPRQEWIRSFQVSRAGAVLVLQHGWPAVARSLGVSARGPLSIPNQGTGVNRLLPITPQRQGDGKDYSHRTNYVVPTDLDEAACETGIVRPGVGTTLRNVTVSRPSRVSARI